MKNPDLVDALQPVIEAFEKFKIPYYIGGSLASSLYGISRATIDVDLVADIKTKHISQLKPLLENQYYFDEAMISDAIHRKSSFNLIHLETMIKIDVFIFKEKPYDESALTRKRKDTLEEGGLEEIYFAAPEDIILNKLHWFDSGGRVSERQWLDVIGVIKVQGNSLDKNYLEFWAKKLHIMDLLEKACQEAGI